MDSIKLEPIKLDNKVRLSADVLNKAQAIADEWGLQNAKAAVEAVFRKYADDYMYGRQPQFQVPHPAQATQFLPSFQPATIGFQPQLTPQTRPIGDDFDTGRIPPSQAASELDGLLGL